MNREIKFRAWDEIDKRMTPSFELETLAQLARGQYDIKFLKEYVNNPCLFKVMQYTGLKDKNGKEIYEGDIVEWIYFNALQRNEVKFVGGSFVSIMTAFKDEFNEMQNLSLISKLDCEIIGNIYPNPELLK